MFLDKEWYKSVTFWGGVLMALAFLLKFLGVDISTEEQTRMAQVLASLGMAIAALVGFIMMIYGRIKSGKQITELTKELKMIKLAKASNVIPAKASIVDSLISWNEQILGKPANAVVAGIMFLATAPGRKIITTIIDGAASPQGKKFIEQLEKLVDESKEEVQS